MIPEKSQLSNPRRLLKSTRPHDNEESRNPLCSKSPYKHRARAIPNRERQILQPLPVHWKQASRGSTNDPRSRANRATKDRSWPKSRRRRPNSASKTPDFGGTPGSSEGSEGGRSSPHLLLWLPLFDLSAFSFYFSSAIIPQWLKRIKELHTGSTRLLISRNKRSRRAIKSPGGVVFFFCLFCIGQ